MPDEERLDPSAQIIVAGARRLAKLSRHIEVHPAHLLLAFLKRPRIERELRSLTNRRGMASFIDILLRSEPKHDGPIRDELKPLSKEVDSLIARAESRSAQRTSQQPAASEDDLFVVLIQAKDRIVDQVLRQYEVDEVLLLWKFDPNAARV